MGARPEAEAVAVASRPPRPNELGRGRRGLPAHQGIVAAEHQPAAASETSFHFLCLRSRPAFLVPLGRRGKSFCAEGGAWRMPTSASLP